MKAHDSEADRAPTGVRNARLICRIKVDVDDAVEVSNRGAYHRTHAVEFELTVSNKPAEVDRAEVADRRFVLVGDLENFGAQVRKVDNV